MSQRKSPFGAPHLARLRESILDITAVVNSPKPDAALIAAAGVALDRALFPLLSRIERSGALGVKELAEFVGRDYTTVSRQVAKLEAQGLVGREPDPADGRVNKAVLTAAGRKMTTAIDRARRKQLEGLLVGWSETDLHDLARLTRRLADDLAGWMKDADGVKR
ncbi:MAG: MarR family winged helix-turn-helix transcriptional regulator [Betaproteobacteria bacterium]